MKSAVLTTPLIFFFNLFSCGPSQEQIDKENAERVKKDSIESAEKIELERLEKIRIDSLNFFTHFSDSLYDRKKLQKAIIYLDSALLYVENLHDNELLQKKANYLLELKKYEAAKYIYTNLIAREFNATDNYYNRGTCYNKMGLKAKAVDDLRKAMDRGHVEAENLYEKINPEKKES